MYDVGRTMWDDGAPLGLLLPHMQMTHAAEAVKEAPARREMAARVTMPSITTESGRAKMYLLLLLLLLWQFTRGTGEDVPVVVVVVVVVYTWHATWCLYAL